MDPILGAALIGGVGSVIGGLFGSEATSESNATNVALARENRDWQAQQNEISRNWMEEMSNTAYQRSVADMKAAGINPIMAYAQGGASTPGNSPTSGGAATVQANVAKAKMAQEMTASALNAAKMRKELDVADATQSAAYSNADQASANAKAKNLETRILIGGYGDSEFGKQLARSPMAQRIAAEVQESVYKASSAKVAYQLLKTQLAGAKNTEAFEKNVGEQNKYLIPVLEILKSANNLRR